MVAVRAGQLAFNQADARHLVDLYDAGIRQMDDEIARLFAEVGAGDETLLIVTSDHGEEFLEHGSVLHGRTQFEEVMRVPLIVRGAGAPAGLRVPTTASLIDVMPTILAAVGVAVPPGLDGSDLAPTWRGGGTELGERYFFGEADHNNAEPDVTRAVRHRKDKLHFDRLTRVQTLFDLHADPGELTDVAPRRPEIVTRLREQLDRFQQGPAPAGDAVNLTPEQIERLRSLGYVH
jgi:arylsulfatase A-like enzyme